MGRYGRQRIHRETGRDRGYIGREGRHRETRET